MKRVFSILFFCLTFLISHAQHLINQLSVNQGLSHSDVSVMLQDKSGFIWLGTNNGLNRFDGYDFKVFKNDLNDENSLPNNRIKSLLCDSKNRIWIASETNVIAYYDPVSGRFKKIPLSEKKYRFGTQIIEDEQENIWVTTNTNELLKLQLKNDSVENSGVLLPFKSDIVSISSFMSQIWICTSADGLWRFNQNTGEIKPVEKEGILQPFSIKKLGDQLLVGASNGVFSINNRSKIKQLYHGKLSRVSSLIKDYKNDIWVGLFDEGVLWLQPDSGGNYQLKQVYNAKNLLSTNRINQLFIDSFDILWIATSGGGVHYIDLRAKPFALINKENSTIPDNYITAIYENQNNYWIGTRSGLTEYNKKTGTSFLKTDGHIAAIFEDRNGQLWVSKRYDGLWVYKNDQLLKIFKADTSGEFPTSEIMGAAEDNFGRIWAATFNKGVVIIDAATKNVLSELNIKSYLPTNNLNFLYLDPKLKGVAWLGSRDKGLLKVSFKDLSKISVTKYEFDPKDSTSLGSNYVWPILRSSKGDLWVGALGAGLNKLIINGKKEGFKRYTEKDGLPDNDIESILEDNAGNLWLGGKGLTKFNPQKQTFFVYDVKDGLQSNSFKIGAAFKNKRGILYFGGINGLNYFNPALIVPNPHKPKLIFDELKILNKTINIGDNIHGRIILNQRLNHINKLEFKANENEFTIELLALHYSNPYKNKYAYKLEGYSNNWVYLTADQRKITFANLPSGNYQFMAKVSNNDGLWSDVRTLEIKILPPWWASWWAYTIYMVIILIALYYYAEFVKRQSQLKNELIIAEKERNLNDEKMKFFTSISHEIRTPLTLIHGPLDDIIQAESDNRKHLDKLSLIRKNVNRLLNLTNQLLDFRKMETGNMQLSVAEGNITAFTKEIYRFFQGLAEEKNIDYRFHSIPERINLTFDRNNFEIILTNLISNAIKYTKNKGEISVSLNAIGSDWLPGVFSETQNGFKLSGNYLEIVIKDTGIGMSPKDLQRIFDRYYQVKSLSTLSIHGTGIGLALVKGLVELHHGEIEVESLENVGSRFIIKIPFGNKHFSEEVILKDFKKSDDRTFYIDEYIQEPDETKEEVEGNELKKRILLVEDNAEVQGYLNGHLKKEYKVILASNGREGYEKAGFYLPDIIISDVMMPEMDGLEMLGKLKKDINLSFIPVILLTARTANLYELEGIEIGAQDYITKPFNINVLKGKIANILLARENYRATYASLAKNEISTLKLPNSEQKFLDKIYKLVLNNLLNEEFSVQKLVQEMGMSQSSCYKRIKELTGRSAVQLIRDIRLQRAAELIKKEEYNISEVAFMVGINDQKHFREKFKEQFGCTPSEFINQN
ncbi:response regulator [Pedobacter sp. SD-b]|uniref:histidine kinase n=1 Tax=Pedobacter segetis TaxID=2793069 RepID=A0ABS1BMD5_9SPHI|nr:two-component regulator propeller domain-containing protein [Pedobacter segetis]MBK0384062.1 response regulator [Pedobacter segetis]